MTKKLDPTIIGQTITLNGQPCIITAIEQTRKGYPFLLVTCANGKSRKVQPLPGHWLAPKGFTVRAKEFDFSAAPDLAPSEGAYIAIAGDEIGSRHNSALNAAVEAARMDYERGGGRVAFVACEYHGERPNGAMRHAMPVSYRPRW